MEERVFSFGEHAQKVGLQTIDVLCHILLGKSSRKDLNSWVSQWESLVFTCLHRFNAIIDQQ